MKTYSSVMLIQCGMVRVQTLFSANVVIRCNQSVWKRGLILVLCFSLLNVLSSHIETHQITSKAFEGGRDIDGERLFICRTRKYGQIIPGKYSNSIGKCSVTHNRREAQFTRYELLIESGDTRYEWTPLHKPVTTLPSNVLFGGNQVIPPPLKRTTSSAPDVSHLNRSTSLVDSLTGELDTEKVDQVLSSDRVWNNKRRRSRRAVVVEGQQDWSPNWRGQLFEGVERIVRFNRRRESLSRVIGGTFTEIPGERRKCAPRVPSLVPSLGVRMDCEQDPEKANFYIAKCALRTGNRTSEQVGKIWWKESIQEWVASFPFGGHEIYCLDYSVLTLKTTKYEVQQ